MLFVADTLTHMVANFVPKLSPYVAVMDCMKLVAGFFDTSYSAVNPQDYWKKLAGR